MPQQKSHTILLIEDNKDIAEMITQYLASHGFIVESAANGITGLNLATSSPHDLIILDLMLPAMSGLKVCEKIRQDARINTPIIMLTARDTVDDKVTGLDTGADDYLIKPFALKELKARINALIRRHQGETTKEVLSIADLTVDTATHQVERAGQLLKLTPIDFKILVTLMRAFPNVVSRQDLEQAVWQHRLPDSETLRSHLYSLRKVVDKPFETHLVQTIFSGGYKIVDPNHEN